MSRSRRSGFAGKDDVLSAETSIHLTDCRLSESGAGSGRHPHPGSRMSVAGAPSAAEQIAQLHWNEAPAFNIDEDTGLAIARAEPPLESLDEDGVCHVAVKSHWMTLESIDSLEQTFKAQIWLQFSWFVRLPPNQLGPEDKIWRPEMSLASATDQRHVGRLRIIERPGGSLIFLTYSISSTFSVQLELHAFPFDCQRIRVMAVFWQSPYDAVTAYDQQGRPVASRPFRGRIQFHEDLSMLYEEGFIDQDAWRVTRDLHMWAGVTDEKRRSKQDGVRFTKLYIGLSIQRRHEYYVMNAIMPFFLFVTFSFLSFGPTDGDQNFGGAGLTDKTQITLAMVLTGAAFKIALTSFTPHVSYMTYLDKYIMSCFAWLGLVAIQNIVSAGVTGRPHTATRERFNLISSVVISGVWFVVHICLGVYLLWRTLRRRAAKRRPAETHPVDDEERQHSLDLALKEELWFDPDDPRVVSRGAAAAEVASRRASAAASDEYGQPFVVKKLPTMRRQQSSAGRAQDDKSKSFSGENNDAPAVQNFHGGGSPLQRAASLGLRPGSTSTGSLTGAPLGASPEDRAGAGGVAGSSHFPVAAAPAGLQS